MSTIKVLGPGCNNCQRLTHLTEQALGELGRPRAVEKVTDYARDRRLRRHEHAGARRRRAGADGRPHPRRSASLKDALAERLDADE